MQKQYNNQHSWHVQWSENPSNESIVTDVTDAIRMLVSLDGSYKLAAVV